MRLSWSQRSGRRVVVLVTALTLALIVRKVATLSGSTSDVAASDEWTRHIESGPGFQLPAAILLNESEGLGAVAAIQARTNAGRTGMAVLQGPGVNPLPPAANGYGRIQIVPWRGHASDLGCFLSPTTVEFAAVNRYDATINHIVVSVSPSDATPTGRSSSSSSVPCAVDFVAGVSVSPPKARWNASLHYVPLTPAVNRGEMAVEYVSVERTDASSIVPFVVPQPRNEAAADWPGSLKKFARPEVVALAPPASIAARLDAPVRCDQGLYMGFTNIIESLVACVIYAVAAKRNHIEYPSRFQHESFLTLFDGDRLRRQVLHVYGVHVSFLDRAVPVVTPTSWHYDNPPRRVKDVAAFVRSLSARPGRRLYIGDVWKLQLILASETQQMSWFEKQIFAPRGQLQLMSETLVNKMRNASRASHVKQRLQGQWVALHLRLEDDRAGHGRSAANASGDTLQTIRRRLSSHFRGSEVPVYYASGPLAPNVSQRIPTDWINKDALFDAAYWASPWKGTWFDGRDYNITNATGSLVDMFVLVEAPLTLLADFSSFGEFVAALRCAKRQRTWMYNAAGDIFPVDCTFPILFMREWQRRRRNHKCGTFESNFLSRSCSEMLLSVDQHWKQIVKLQAMIEDHAASLKKRTPTF